MKNEISLKPTYWASVSGGKDSLYMLNLILHNLDKYPLDGVVHFELEIDYPFITEVINYMEKECKKFNIPFYRIKPRTSWEDIYNKYGYPTRLARWCNSKYKLDSKAQLVKMELSKGNKVIHYIGYCVDEVKRYDKRLTDNEIYPLVNEGVNESYILEWAKKQPIFNDYYKYNRRCGCMGCPMASRLDLAYLYVYYPDKFNYFMYKAKETEVKREQELKRPFSVWASNPKYNTEYVINNVITKYVPKIL